MATTTEIIVSLTLKQQEFNTAVVGKFNAVKTALTDKASTAYVDDKFEQLVGLAPSTLDTLQEIATAISGNQDSIGALSTQIAARPTTAAVETLISTAVAGIDYSSVNTDITAVETLANQALTRVGVVETDLATYISDNDAALANTNADVATALTGLAAAQTDVGQLQVAVFGDPQDPQSASIAQQITGVETAISDVVTLVDGHTAILTAHTAQINSKASSADLISVTARVTTAEAGIVTLTNNKADAATVTSALATKAAAADLTALEASLQDALTELTDNYTAVTAALAVITF